MFLQPFLGGLIVLRTLTWAVAPALAAVVLLFLIREPLTVLARQRWVWREPHAETAAAKKYALTELLLLGVAGAALLFVWPWWLLAALGAAGAGLTAFAVYMTLKNRQRSIVLQGLSAAGLSSSVLAACLAVDLNVPDWAWWFWGLHAAHFLAGILVVHLRLETRIAAKKGGNVLTPAVLERRRDALIAALAMTVGAAVIFWMKLPWFAGAAFLSGVSQIYDLATAHRPGVVAMPLMKVGRRALAKSIVFTGLVIVGAISGS